MTLTIAEYLATRKPLEGFLEASLSSYRFLGSVWPSLRLIVEN